jgi:LssY C-terminus
MMRSLNRLLRRLIVLGIGAVSVWLIVFVIFRIADNKLSWILATAITYVIAAYVVLPRAVRMSLKVLQRKHVPRYTITGDGLPGDPVNLILKGTRAQLDAAFAAAGWSQADPLTLASSWRMVRTFLLNRPYPTAPFSTLYLYGRGQDIGFQKAIDNSPRRRHHVRFWALSLERTEAMLGQVSLWLNDDKPADNGEVYWIGAGTKDTGFSLTRLTFQVTHATDSDTNAERNFIIAELKQCGVIGEINVYQPRSGSPPRPSITMSPTAKSLRQACRLIQDCGPRPDEIPRGCRKCRRQGTDDVHSGGVIRADLARPVEMLPVRCAKPSECDFRQIPDRPI